MATDHFDVIFAGGGLAASLAAYRLRQLRPELRLLIIEEGGRLGGNHIWSFHDGALDPASRQWIEPFIAWFWPRQQVRFPRHSRMLAIGYHAISSIRLHDVACRLLGESVLLATKAAALAPHWVQLPDGRVFSSRCVIDARGQRTPHGLALAYQKFAGVEVRLVRAHGETYPTIMDATVPQRDGYRFVYVLPLAPDRLLIEDTHYSDTPALDISALRDACFARAAAKKWEIAETLREEQGVLPVVLGGDPEAFFERKAEGVPALGVRAGFFHHTTSDSLPFAVRLADEVARSEPLASESLDLGIRRLARRHWREQHFFRLLNRMLFWAAKPEERYRVLERFYEMREPTIARFYASRLTRADRLRILVGRPPVPVGRALRVWQETGKNPLGKARP